MITGIRLPLISPLSLISLTLSSSPPSLLGILLGPFKTIFLNSGVFRTYDMTEFGHHKVVDWLDPGVLSLPVVEDQVSPDYLARVQQVLAIEVATTFAVEAKKFLVLLPTSFVDQTGSQPGCFCRRLIPSFGRFSAGGGFSGIRSTDRIVR